MPNLSRCKQKDGKLYCWDHEIKAIVGVILTPLKLSEVPSSIIEDFIDDSTTWYVPYRGLTCDVGDEKNE